MAKAKKGSLLGRINPVSLGSTADASFMIEKVDEKAANPATPDMAHLLGKEGDYGKDLKLDNKWAYNIIKKIGNYAEIFDRNLGPSTPMKLDRNLNKLYKQGGLLYSPPFK